MLDVSHFDWLWVQRDVLLTKTARAAASVREIVSLFPELRTGAPQMLVEASDVHNDRTRLNIGIQGCDLEPHFRLYAEALLRSK